MKRLSLLAVLLFAQTSFAESPKAEDRPVAVANPKAESLIATNLVGPLAEKENARSKFSRARMPAAERRVRIIDQVAQKDSQGATFVRFAIDERRGYFEDENDSGWSLASITGCAYVDKGEVFVQKGEQFRPAAFLLGKNLKAAPASTCVSTQVASR